MNISVSEFQRFIYSHHFYSGLRRAAGTLLPILVVGGIFGWYAQGLIATFGALCVAFIDQPGPHENRRNEMLGGVLLSTLAVAVTGLATSHPVLIWIAVIGQCFLFSMLSVYGKKGGQIGFACLLLMTVTMHSPLTTEEVWRHTLVSMGGGLFYALFSYSLSQIMSLREKEQALSVALFATSDYIARRADMYNLDNDLDDSYRKLIACQSDMTEKHQAARDMVLRGLATLQKKSDPRRIMLWNLFIEMITILDTLVATHTDYAVLRRELGGSDAILFMRDALYKMSMDLDRIALAVSRNRTAQHRSSVKAELRALEFEIEQMHNNGFAQQEPDAYSLCVQVLRRLRNNARIVERMYEYTRGSSDTKPIQAVNMDNSLSEFLSRQQFRVGMITSNLRIDSPFCRYALRVTLAAGIAMTLSTLIPTLARQGYWILLTVLIIMKPGFALTRQRNGWRLLGTLTGCAMAFGVLYTEPSNSVLLAIMVVSTIIGGSMLQINYMAASTFNTNAVLLAFHFIDPSSITIIGDRAVDTLIGSIVCFACSYFLPWWESQFMPSLARAAVSANREYLRCGLNLLDVRQAAGNDMMAPAVQQADLAWRLSRKNVHIAFSNFAEAFYRMMLEPQSRQRHVAEFNNLMIQSHMLASQVAAVMSIFLNMPRVPEVLTGHLAKILPALTPNHEDTHLEPLPAVLSEGKFDELAYPMRQLQRSVHRVQLELKSINGNVG